MAAQHQAPKKERIVSITINEPNSGYSQCLLFNRFFLARPGANPGTEPFILIHFGFIDESGILVSHFRAAIWRGDLRRFAESFSRFLQDVGGILHTSTSWQPPPTPGANPFHPVNNIALARTGDVGEVLLANFTIKELVRTLHSKSSSGQSPSIVSEPVALLRCHLSVLRQFVTALVDPANLPAEESQPRVEES